MKDAVHELLKFIDHERYKIFGLLIGVLIVVSMIGCDVKIKSPFSSNIVTRKEFDIETMTAEIDLDMERIRLEQANLAFNKKIELHNEQKKTAEEMFIEKEKLTTGFIEIAAGVATTLTTGGQLNTAQILMSFLTLGGIGTAVGGVVDSARKNKVIKNQKNNNVP